MTLPCGRKTASGASRGHLRAGADRALPRDGAGSGVEPGIGVGVDTFNDRLGVIDARLAKHSDRLDLVEKLAERNTQSLGFGERLFWVVATVGAGIAGKMLFGG